jgi:uncharacterized surface protein with fasciclin (FAS1) repeats
MINKAIVLLIGRTWLVSLLFQACLMSAGALAQGDCADVEPPATGFGFFRRSLTCSQVAGRGQCASNVSQGYCLQTCDACPAPEAAPEPVVEQEDSPDTGVDLDPETAAAAAYREQLLEQVAIMEDGTAEVEALPSLMYDRDLPPMPEEDGVAYAAVEEDSSDAGEVEVLEIDEPLCDEGSALNALVQANLTTLIEVAESINVASVLNDTTITFTLFAPNNEAWETAFPDLEKQLEDSEGTTNLVFTHLIADQQLEELVDGSVTPLSGAVLFIRDGDKIISRAATGNVLDTIVGCNWVVHVIDDVLGEDSAEASPDFAEILRG